MLDGTRSGAAARLFEFLRDVQRLRVKPVLAVGEYITSGGMVVDLDSVPRGFGAETGGLNAPDGSAPVLRVPRLTTTAAPPPPDEIRPWIRGDWDSPTTQPELLDSLSFPSIEESGTGPIEVREESLVSHPEVEGAYRVWLDEWTSWAERQRATKPTRDLYQRLYIARETISAASQEWELVLGVGRLRWSPADRHVLVQPLRIELDESSGALSVLREDAFVVEQDMLSPQQLPTSDAIAALSADLGIAFEDDLMSERLKAYTNRLNPDATFGDPPSDPTVPWMRTAPSVILRKRSRLGLVDALDQIASYLAESEEVPEGLIPLVDPDSVAKRPDEMQPSDSGAVHWHDDEYFLPLPVNAEQFEVIRRVDHQPLTLVQGPPGTGKTHTTAALISHLLAQGKRVLVTAQTEQALREVREKLPAEIRDLAVAVLGTGQAERALLTRSVGVLAERAHHHSQGGVEKELAQLKESLDRAARQRAESRNRLVELRQADVAVNSVGPYSGTRAQIAESVNDLRSRYEWTQDVLPNGLPVESPLSSEEWLELLDLLRDTGFSEFADALNYVLPDLSVLPNVPSFEEWVTELASVDREIASLRYVGTDHKWQALRTADESVLAGVVAELRDIRSAMKVWTERQESWIAECLVDIRAGKSTIWVARQEAIKTRIQAARQCSAEMGDEHSIKVDESLEGHGQVMAQVVLDFLKSGEVIKTDALGTPKLGIFTSKTVKACAPLFDGARVDGRPPTSISTLNRIIARAQLLDQLTGLDGAWPLTVIPPEDTLAERLAWHEGELEVLDRILTFAERILRVSDQLNGLGVPNFDWTDSKEIGEVFDFAALLDSERRQEELLTPMLALAGVLSNLDSPTRPSPSARALATAIANRDSEAYSKALDSAAVLVSVLARRNRRDELLDRARQVAPGLTTHLERTATDPTWVERLVDISSAWAWRYALAWIQKSSPESINRLQLSIRDYEDQMREIVGQIAAHLAWSKSVGRLKQSQISDLVQYTQLVKKLGKGTGKYAARRQQEIRKVLVRCTDSVPVWIVPLHRVATQFRVQPELFDVVVIDEASQAGLEATFLQFLGRKIVVVGDDRQVSPTVIIDHSNVHRLAEHYLADSPYASTWSDPERSLFDEARAKYQDLITLVEHRRCVPDIIGFSNEIAYEPDGIRLKPVREPGSSALEPFVSVLVEDGYAQGSGSSRRNPAEARAIVDSIKEALGSPRYANKTFGVISLLGEPQARLIESMLLDEVGPLEIAKRELRCGVAATFQGAERDVIFLSMVAASDEEQKFAAQTKESAVQRYNVAVSRAKDQLWVFHSEPLSALTNAEDLRRRLLEYADRVAKRRGSGIPGATQGLVPEDVRVSPFGSLFEQRVHNRIFERGYVIVPQYESLGYQIDLVVVGERGKFAIECDGDHWHGVDQYEADLARQRELERCGWNFFRLRQSDFTVDPFGSLEPLWPLLDSLTAADEANPLVISSDRNEGDEITDRLLLDLDSAWEDDEQIVTEVVSGEDPLDILLNWKTGELEEEISGDTALGERVEESQTAPPPSPTLAGVGSGDQEGVEASVKKVGEQGATGVSQPEGKADYLRPYVAWSKSSDLAPSLEASSDALAAAMREIIEVEGPVLGSRVMQAYVRASGGLRLGRRVANRLSEVLDSLHEQGLIVVDNPTRTRNRSQMTYRTQAQPVVKLRELGPRTLYEVPTSELREVIGRAADDEGKIGRLARKAVLRAYGLSRLEEKADSHLLRVSRFPRPSTADLGDS